MTVSAVVHYRVSNVAVEPLSRVRLSAAVPGSSVHGLLQARTREGIAISSRGSSRLRD